MELKPNLIIADRFRLERLLGEGGMGAVWLAYHLRLQIPCALKFMHAEVAADPNFRSRFDREAVIAAQLRSPHVVQILDHGVWEEMPYIAMEFLEGEDLEHRLDRCGKLSFVETAAIVTQVARALTKAHAAGLVHRDLKPANIFIVHDDDREIAKVLDFGIAKNNSPTAGSQTKTGAAVGTPYYMSPEQVQGNKNVDHRTDLWALAVVVYQCVTGRLPFESDAFGALVLKIIVERVPVPSQFGPVPAGFDAWWARAVERDPAARFQSAKEMADALADALDVRVGETVGAASAVQVKHPLQDPLAGDVASRVPTPTGEVWLAATAALPITQVSGASLGDTGARAKERSRTLVLGAVVAAALVAGIAFVALRGSATAASPPVNADVASPPRGGATVSAIAAPALSVAPAASMPVVEPVVAPLGAATVDLAAAARAMAGGTTPPTTPGTSAAAVPPAPTGSTPRALRGALRGTLTKGGKQGGTATTAAAAGTATPRDIGF